MSEDRSDHATETVLDPRLAPKRLKEGLVPPDTGIFLRVEEGPPGESVGRVFTLSAGGVYLIGRKGADIVLEGSKVSRKHAELGLYGPEAWVLRDLHSTNGTRVNGRRISDRTRLTHWDLVQVGEYNLRFAVIEGSIRPD